VLSTGQEVRLGAKKLRALAETKNAPHSREAVIWVEKPSGWIGRHRVLSTGGKGLNVTKKKGAPKDAKGDALH
jgi:hypothetical protein